MATAQQPPSEDQLRSYQENGFLTFENILTHAECDELLARLEYIVTEKPAGISIQVEPSMQGTAEASKVEHVRKVSDLVAHDQVYGRIARKPAIIEKAQAILGEKILLFRDVVMVKPAHHGSAKPYHQDNAYWNVEPMDLCSVWIALEDATLENGCMRLVRGSHQEGLIQHEHLEDFMVTDDKVDYSREVAAPLKKGGALFFHSLLLHATSPNTSDHSRRAMILSLMGAHCTWNGQGQKPAFVDMT